MAERLVAAGYEAPSRIHAEAAAECMLRAISCFDLRAEDPGAKAAKFRKLTAALEEYRREAGPRSAHSESLLR